MTPKRRSSRISGKTGLLKEESDRRVTVPERAALRKSPRISALQQARSAASAKGQTDSQDIAVTFAKASTNATASSSRTVRSKNEVGQTGNSVSGKGKLFTTKAVTKKTCSDRSGKVLQNSGDKVKPLEGKIKSTVAAKKKPPKDAADELGESSVQKKKGALNPVNTDQNSEKERFSKQGRNKKKIDQAQTCNALGKQDKGKSVIKKLENKPVKKLGPQGTKGPASEDQKGKKIKNSASVLSSFKLSAKEVKKARGIKNTKSEGEHPCESGDQSLPSTSGRTHATEKKTKNSQKKVTAVTRPAKAFTDKKGGSATTSKWDPLPRQY